MTTYQFSNLALFGGPWGAQRDNPKYTRLLLFAWWKITILPRRLCSWFDIYERGYVWTLLTDWIRSPAENLIKKVFSFKCWSYTLCVWVNPQFKWVFYEVRIMIWIFLKLKSNYLSCPAFSGVGYRIVHEAHQGLGGRNLLINIF